MKMFVISDNHFYRNTFSGVHGSITVSLKDELLINEYGLYEFHSSYCNSYHYYNFKSVK